MTTWMAGWPLKLPNYKAKYEMLPIILCSNECHNNGDATTTTTTTKAESQLMQLSRQWDVLVEKLSSYRYYSEIQYTPYSHKSMAHPTYSNCV